MKHLALGLNGDGLWLQTSPGSGVLGVMLTNTELGVSLSIEVPRLSVLVGWMHRGRNIMTIEHGEGCACEE